MDLINLFEIKEFLRMWFQEYTEFAVLNWISVLVLLYTNYFVLFFSLDTRFRLETTE